MADKQPQTTERFTSQALDDAERGSAIVKVVTKRIRAASKRMKKIEATEAKAQGQPDKINQDQKELLDSKPKTLANIEELERLIPLLQEAEGEERSTAVKKAVEKALAEERASVAAQAPPAPAEPAEPASISDEAKREIESQTIDKLLHLLYFTQTFDFDKPGELTSLERNACLCYYNQQHPDRNTPLMPEDFNLLCKLGSRMVSRPTTVCISHAEALQQAHDLALQWLYPTDEPMDIVEGRTMNELKYSLERMMDSEYVSVRPVLAQPSPQHQADNIPPSSDPIQAQQDEALQDWPVTPELNQQDSHTFSDMTPPTEPSPRESPIPPESSQTHYAPPDHPNAPSYQGQSYGQPDPDHERYPQPQNGYAAPVQTNPNGETPNGQDYHTGSAPALMNFTNGVSADMGPSGSANSQELGRASGQDAVLDSSLTNGHLPSEGNQGVSDGRPPSFQAPLQGSQAGYGTRERGDGARGPERQASYNRGYGGGRYEGGPPRGRNYRGRGDTTGRGEFNSRGGGRRGRGDSYRGRGNFSSGGEYGRGPRGGHQRSQQEETRPQSGS